LTAQDRAEPEAGAAVGCFAVHGSGWGKDATGVWHQGGGPRPTADVFRAP
jgi:hypothetical protein